MVLSVLVTSHLLTAINIELLDAINVKFLRLECNLIGVRCNLFGKLADSVGPGSREQDNLAVPWQKSTMHIRYYSETEEQPASSNGT